MSSDDIDPSEFETDSEDATLPLTAADLPKAHTELAEWMDPGEFRRRVHGFDKRSPSRELFNDNRYKFLRDAALALSELSKHKQFAQIRLADPDEDWPDGYARTETEEVIKIEVTSAHFPGRLLGAEYKSKERMQHDSLKNCIKRAEYIPTALEDAIGDKLKKQYSERFALVVDLTFISDGGVRQAETKRAIANIKDKYGPAFQHFWVLWKDKVF